jgi:hypothetical protein
MVFTPKLQKPESFRVVYATLAFTIAGLTASVNKKTNVRSFFLDSASSKLYQRPYPVIATRTYFPGHHL